MKRRPPLKERTRETVIAQRLRRTDAIQRFITSNKGEVASLALAIDWLAFLRPNGERDIQIDPTRWNQAVEKIKSALFEGKLDAEHTAITMVWEDQEIETFSKADITEARRSSMYKNPRAAYELLKRLWVSPLLLRELFNTERWPLPNWLIPTADNIRNKKPARKQDLVLKEIENLFKDRDRNSIGYSQALGHVIEQLKLSNPRDIPTESTFGRAWNIFWKRRD